MQAIITQWCHMIPCQLEMSEPQPLQGNKLLLAYTTSDLSTLFITTHSNSKNMIEHHRWFFYQFFFIIIHHADDIHKQRLNTPLPLWNPMVHSDTTKHVNSLTDIEWTSLTIKMTISQYIYNPSLLRTKMASGI